MRGTGPPAARFTCPNLHNHKVLPTEATLIPHAGHRGSTQAQTYIITQETLYYYPCKPTKSWSQQETPPPRTRQGSLTPCTKTSHLNTRECRRWPQRGGADLAHSHSGFPHKTNFKEIESLSSDKQSNTSLSRDDKWAAASGQPPRSVP